MINKHNIMYVMCNRQANTCNINYYYNYSRINVSKQGYFTKSRCIILYPGYIDWLNLGLLQIFDHLKFSPWLNNFYLHHTYMHIKIWTHMSVNLYVVYYSIAVCLKGVIIMLYNFVILYIRFIWLKFENGLSIIIIIKLSYYK